MALERRRGITIRAAVTSFALGDLDVNLVDTPGHPDFIAEVERSLVVLDAAVLVMSSVEGVQPQTVVIWRALQRIGVPTVMFVNKVDRAGADVDRVVGQIRRRLTPHAVVLARASGQGRRDAAVAGDRPDRRVGRRIRRRGRRPAARPLGGRRRRRRPATCARTLRRGVRRGDLTPVLCGSAITGAGTPQLRRVLTELLPAAVGRRRRHSGRHRLRRRPGRARSPGVGAAVVGRGAGARPGRRRRGPARSG